MYWSNKTLYRLQYIYLFDILDKIVLIGNCLLLTLIKISIKRRLNQNSYESV